MRPALPLIALAAGLPVFADTYQRHHITAGLGVAIPKQELSRYYQNAFSWTFGYGYRPIRYLQLDAGFDSSYLAADVNDYYYTPNFGPLRIRDFQYFIPYGARAVLPLARGRVELYGGAGGAYMRYTELLRQPSNYFRVECPVCTARSGHGWYALAGASVALDRDGHFRLGGIVRDYRGHTEGQSVGTLPPVRTNDRWLNIYGTFSFTF